MSQAITEEQLIERLLADYSRNRDQVRPQILSLLPNISGINLCMQICVQSLQHFNDRQLAEAATLRAFELAPTNSALVKLLGHLAFEAKRFEEARGYFEIESRLTPDAPDVWNRLAETYLLLLDTERASSAAAKALSLDPQSPNAFYHHLDALILADRFDQAIDEGRQHLAKGGDEKLLLGLLTKAFLRSGCEVDAIGSIERLRELSPEDPEPAQQLISLHERAGRLDDARRTIDDAVRSGLDANPTFLRALGNFHARQGDDDEARRHYDRHQERFGITWQVALSRLGVDRRELVKQHCVDESMSVIGEDLDEATQSRLEPMEYVEFATLVYGTHSCAIWTHLGLPSVLNSCGFDEILKTRRVAWGIYTDTASLPDLKEAIDMIRARGITVLLNHKILDIPHQFRGIHRGLAVYDQVRRCARRRGQMIVAYADFIFGDGVDYLTSQLTSPGCLAVTKPRVIVNRDAERLSAELRSGSFTNRNRTLLKRTFSEYLHPMTTGALISQNGRFEVRETLGGYNAHFFRPPTIALAPDESALSYMLDCDDVENGGLDNMVYAHDSHFLEWAEARDNLKLVSNSDDFMFFEATGTHERNDLRFFLKEAPSWEPPMSKRLFDAGCQWRLTD